MTSPQVCRRFVVGLFTVFLLFTTAKAQDYEIFKWNEATGVWEKNADGAASRISVGPDGSPWVVNSAGAIFHLVNNSWQLLPGKAKDIGVGADGTVWVIGGDPKVLEDDGIFRLDGKDWTQVAGAALNVSVGKGGKPWVVNSKGNIFILADGGFREIPGLATDIGVGGDFDSPWVTGLRGGVFYMGRERKWVQVSGDAYRISVGPDGKPWVVTLQKTIYRWVNDKFELIPGRANDIGIGADGSVWVIGYSEPTVTGLPGGISWHPAPSPKATPKPRPPADTPVPGASAQTLVCRGSRDPNAFLTSHRLFESNPGYSRLVIDFAYTNVAWGAEMEQGSCILELRKHRQDDPTRLIEDVPDDTEETSAQYLRNANHYWMFTVYHYVSSTGEHYFKVSSSRLTGRPGNIDP